MTRSEFAAEIKRKYPAYQTVDDNALVDEVLRKYPVYKGQISDTGFTPAKDQSTENKGFIGSAIDAQKGWFDRSTQEGNNAIEGLKSLDFLKTTGAVGKSVGDLIATEAGVGLSGVGKAISSVLPSGVKSKSSQIMNQTLEAIGNSIPDSVKKGAIGTGQYVSELLNKHPELARAIGDVANTLNLAPAAGIAKGLKGAFGTSEDLIQKAVAEASRKPGMVEDLAKSAVSRFTNTDRKLIERVSASPEELARIKQAGIDRGSNGVSTLAKDVKEATDDINAKSLDQYNERIDQVESTTNKMIEDRVRSIYDRAKEIIGGNGDIPSMNEIGNRIEDSRSKAISSIGERFGSAQNQYLNETSSAFKLGIHVIEGQKPINTLQKNIADVLQEAGSNNKGEFKGGVASIGNSVLKPEDVKDLKQFQKLAGKAEDTMDVLNQLKLLRKVAGSPKADGSFYNHVVIGKLDNAYQKTIEEQLTRYSSENNIGDNLVSMWRENNKRYHDAMASLDDIKKGTGIGRLKSEQLPDKIKSIGVDELNKIKDLAARDDVVASVWKDLQTGFSDNLIAKSMKPDGSIDYKSLGKYWQSINSKDSKLAETLLGKEQSDKISSIISEQIRISSENEQALKLAATEVKSLEKLIKDMKFGKGVGGDYNYIVSKLDNIGTNTAASRSALDELKSLDEILGNSTDDGFAKRALSMYDAKKLGVTDMGNVPVITNIPTGKSLAGGLLGLVLGIPGMLLGTYSQSPAGAIAAYKIINKIATMPNPLKSPVVRGAIAGASVGGMSKNENGDNRAAAGALIGMGAGGLTRSFFK